MKLSPAIQAQLREAWAAGLAVKAIAQQLGFRSANTVTTAAIRLKLPSRRLTQTPHKVTPAMREDIRTRYGQERTLDLASRLGISRALVVAIAKDEGCDMRGGRALASQARAAGRGQPTSRVQPLGWRCDCGQVNGAETDCIRCGTPAPWKSMFAGGRCT